MPDIHALVKERNFTGPRNSPATPCIRPAPRRSGCGTPSGSSRCALTGDEDGGLILWALETGEAIHNYAGHDDVVVQVSFSTDGTFAVTSGFDGTVRIWRVHHTLEELVDWVRQNRYVRELTCEERALYDVEPLCPT